MPSSQVGHRLIDAFHELKRAEPDAFCETLSALILHNRPIRQMRTP